MVGHANFEVISVV